ncbi:MAG: DNRLRE domain-containing protein [Bacteroidales bacterium]
MEKMKRIIAYALIFIFMTGLVPANVLAASSKDSKNDLKDQDASIAAIGKIVGEVTDKRNKSTKVYRKDDGSFEAEIYDTAVHYQDSTGQWKDIDNSLVDAKDDKGNDILKNKENSFDVEISKNAKSDKLVNIKKNGYELSWNINMVQSGGSTSTALTDSTNLLNNDKAATDSVATSSGSTSTDSNAATTGNTATDSSASTSGSAATDSSAATGSATTDSSTVVTDSTVTMLGTPASVSASVEQIDENKVQSKIDKIANDKAAKTQGYDKLPDSKKAEIVQISKYNEEQKTLKKISYAVDFKQIFTDIDLTYSVKGDSVKEDIVINKATENPVFKFNLNLTNLIPKIDNNKNIVFYDAKDPEKAIYIMQAPFMYDAKNESSSNIDITVDKGTDGYVLTVKPDAAWLNDAKRAYPVTIDPSVSTSIDVNSIKDAYVSSANPNTNYYLNTLLKTGYGSTSYVDRTFIKFTSLPQISSSEMITNAWLEVACSSTEGSHVNVHEVLNNWDSSTITWNNQPAYNPIVEDYQQVLNGNTIYDWNITNIAKKWYSTNNNYGLILKANYEGPGGYTDYYSSDQSSYTRPQASITYVSNVGLESYWTYHSANAGRAGTGYTNDYNGNLVFIHDDLSMNGSRMPVKISHVYNSSEARTNDWSKQWMGAGWTMDIMERVDYKQIGSTNYWIYTDEDGTKHYFVDNGTTELKDELNLGYTFSTDISGYHYVKDKSGNKLKFYWNGYLYGIIDNNGNEMHADWSDAPGTGVKTLTTLTDGANRVTHLGYDNNGILSYITDPAGRSTWFSYDTQSYQKLTQITYPDGKITNFNYDSNYKLISATNYDGTKLTYEYYTYSPYRVKKVLESNGSTLGEELNFGYGNNTTTMTDYQGRKNIYQFNNSGKTVCVQDSDGNASYSDYSDSSNISKSTLESKLQKTQTNYILNHNMEADSNWTPASWSGATGTQTLTIEDKYMGNRSMKITSTSTNGGLDYEQSGIQLVKGNTYTFSGYVKTLGVSSGSNSGAAIFVGYQDAIGTTQYFKKYINGTTDWHREEMQFTLPANASSNTVFIGCEIISATGTAYFDCVQLESGSIANRYNLIENSDFKYGTSFWAKGDQCNTSDFITTAGSDHPATFDNSVFNFTGQEDMRKNLLQTVNVPGKAGDTLVVGGWAKADSVPIYDSRKFSLTIGLKLPSGDYEWHDAAFNTDSSQWQYLSKKIVSNSDYTQIAYYICYYNNANSAMFDGIQLYKEEFGDSYSYDANGNVMSTSDLAKQSSSFAYNSNNDLTKSTDAKGNNFQYEYDGNHNVTKGTSSENVVYSFTYDSSGNPMTSKVGDSSLYFMSSAVYTADGNYISSMTDSSGNAVTNDWNSDKGVLNKVTDAAGKTISYTYDSNTDNLLSVSKQVDGQNVTNSYTYENDKIKTITHNGFSYNFGYDALGNNTTVAVGSQNLITNSYEARTGKLLSSTYGNNQVVSNSYDNLDRIISKKYGSDVRFTYQYDGSSNLGYKVDNVNGVTFRFIYDLADRLVKIVDSLGNSTTYDYESANNSITSIKLWHYYGDSRKYHDVIVQLSNDPTFKVGVTTVYNNDTDNSAGLGTGSNSEYNESSAGNTITVNSTKARYVRVYSNGNSVNGFNHYVEAQVNGAPGNMAAGKSITSSNAFTNSSRITDGSTDTNSYSDSTPNSGLQWVQIDLGAPSNLGDNLTKLSETIVNQSSPITTSYEYDKDNRLKKVITNKGSYLTNNYDTLGRLSGKTITDGTTNYNTSYTYLAGANGSTTTKVGSITNNGTAVSYTYDCNGNISTITQGSQLISYVYNELNEVTRENNEVLNKTITYSYDAGGNIQSKVEYPYTTGTLGTVTNTINYSYGDSNWKDKLTSYNGKGVTYDAIGNPLTYDGWTYTWEEGRQLKTVSGNSHSISYKYDDSGIRTQKVVDGVTSNYHLVGDKVTYEDNGTDKIYYTYDSANDLVSMNLNGTEYYYIKNGQGDVLGLIDSNGIQVVSYTYDSWGKLISTNGNLASTLGIKNPYRYRGYRYDTETQLYYLQSRYYNPEWGRFISADSIAGNTGELLTANMFAYCRNNFVNNSDPNGEFILDAIFLASDISTFMAHPSLKNAGWVALSAVCFVDASGISSSVIHAGRTLRVATETLHKVEVLKGGRFADVDKIRKVDEVGHHMAQNAYNKKIGISRDDGPALLMSKADHAKTRTYAGKGKKTMRIDKGLTARQRLARDVADVRSQFGRKYNQGLRQTIKYAKTLKQYQK